MAENKSSFILYSDSKEVVEALTDEQAGKLLKHIFGYVNDENPICDDPFVSLAFIPIKQSLKRDLKKWEGKQEQRKEAGKRSAEIRKQNANEAKRKATTVNDRSVSSTVNVSGNGNVNGKENILLTPIVPIEEPKKLSKEETFDLFWNHFHDKTNKPKEKKKPALVHWKKLSLEEQRKAYGQVEAFAVSNVDKDYLPICRTYLADKVFNDEFVIGKAKIPANETYEQRRARTQPNKPQTF